MTQQIQIFTSNDGQAQLEATLEQDTVWLNVVHYLETPDSSASMKA